MHFSFSVRNIYRYIAMLLLLIQVSFRTVISNILFLLYSHMACGLQSEGNPYEALQE